MLRERCQRRSDREQLVRRGGRNLLTCWVYVLALLGLSPSALAATYNVGSGGAFTALFDGVNEEGNPEAQPGDQILIENGTHADWGVLTVSHGGIESLPIVIRSQTQGGATLSGDVNLKIFADWIVLRDLRFEGPSEPWPYNYTVLLDHAEHVRITNVTFKDRGDVSQEHRWFGNIMLDTAVHFLEIDHNIFDGYITDAFYMYVKSENNGDFPTDIHIHHNEFLNGQVEEAIALGSGNYGNDGSEETRVVIEDNLFENHINPPGGGGEMLQIKTSSNVIHRNTFIDCVGHISNRAGTNNIYDGNLIVRQEHKGVRIIDANNQVINNLFIDTEKPILFTYSDEHYALATNTLIAHNTFIGTTVKAISIYQQPGSTVPPELTTIRKNVFIGAGDHMLAEYLGEDYTLANNLFYDPEGQPIQGPTGDPVIFGDPQLSPADETGFFIAGSPVIDAGVCLPEVTTVYGHASRPAVDCDIGHLETCNGPDSDGDGVCDDLDNCPDDLNPAQEDHDHDGVGTACDIACSDGFDNDGDDLIDSADPGCGTPAATLENPACNDGADNDGDDLIDYPADPGCIGASDLSEIENCRDGLDNDGDFLTDIGEDPGCFSNLDQTEKWDCEDGIDNDGDGLIDYPADPDCDSSDDGMEVTITCGLGFEIALLLPALMRLRRKRGRRITESST